MIRDYGMEENAMKIAEYADLVVFPSAFVKEGFEKICDLPPEKVVIRPQGLYQHNPVITSYSIHYTKLYENGAEQIFTNTNVAIDPSTTFQIEEGFYAGIKFNHFGHFLLESLSRLTNLKSSGHTNVIWVSKTNNRIFSKWQIDT